MTRASFWRAGTALVLALLPLAAAGAQDKVTQRTVEGELVPRRAFVATVALADAGQNRILEAVALFLTIEIEASTRLVVTAEEAKADLTVRLSAAPAGRGFRLSASASGPALEASGGAAPFEYAATLAELGVEASAAFRAELAKRLDAAFPPVRARVTEIVTERVVEETEVITREQGVTLTIRAPAGTLLRLPDGERALMGEDGLWTAELPQNSSFAYRAELPGHYPQNRIAFIGDSDVTDEPGFIPLNSWRFGMDIRYLNLLFVPQAEWHFMPGRAFLQLGVESSALAPVRLTDKDDDPPLLHYIDLQLGGGLFWGHPDDRLRTALTLGLAGRFDAGKRYFGLAAYAPLSVRAGLRLSWELNPRLSAFVEGNSRLALILAPEGANPATVLHPMPYGLMLLKGGAFFEWPTFFVGARYGL